MATKKVQVKKMKSEEIESTKILMKLLIKLEKGKWPENQILLNLKNVKVRMAKMEMKKVKQVAINRVKREEVLVKKLIICWLKEKEWLMLVLIRIREELMNYRYSLIIRRRLIQNKKRLIVN